MDFPPKKSRSGQCNITASIYHAISNFQGAMSGGCQFDRFFKFSVFKPVIYYQVGELKMEHNGIRQAKSVIVNRNAYSPGRTLSFVYHIQYMTRSSQVI